MPAPRLFTLTTLLALVAALAQPAQAQGVNYTFSQGGYADGATVTGHFAGSDIDGDGWIYGYELTEFELNWSGNRAVEAFSLGFDERAGIEFQLSDRSLQHMAGFSQDGEGVRHFSYESRGWPTYAIPGVITDERLGLVTMSNEDLQLTAVPEPRSLALLLAGMGLIGLWTQRRRIG